MRREIENGVVEGRSPAWMAEGLGVDATSVSRELRRNRSLRNDCAHRKACARRRICDPDYRRKCSSCARMCGGGGVRGLRAPAVWAHASGAMGLQRLREAPDLPPGAVRLLGQDGAGQGRRAPRGVEAGPGHDRPRDGVPGPGGQGGARQGPVGPPRLRLQGRPPPLGALLLPPRRERGHRRG